MALKLRRGLETNRTDIIPQQGEILYTTDTKELYVGDGTTSGGTKVSGISVLSGLTDVDLVGVIDGDYIQYSAASGTWVAGVPTVIVAHGDTTGLDADDHPQYALSGSFATHTGDSTIHFTEASIDHGSIAGLGDNDHPRYSQSAHTHSDYTTDTEFDAHTGTHTLGIQLFTSQLVMLKLK